MRRLLVLLCLCICAGAVSAEQWPRNGMGDPQQAVRDQRRVQLREVLRSEHHLGAELDTPIANASPLPSRHLTPQERFELREQLRREQNESRGNRR